MARVIRAHIVSGGMHHDFDFVRLEMLKLLSEHEHVRTTVSSDYAPTGEIAGADFLITYTNAIYPEGEQLAALKAFLARGGRWFAMHGTSAIVRFTDGPPQDLKVCMLPGEVVTPDLAPDFMRIVGGRFLAHLPYQSIHVEPASPGDKLLAGVGAFDVFEEAYFMELGDDIEILLESRYTGSANGYQARDWPDDDVRPILWRRREGAGEIVYSALGHRSGRYDHLDLIDEMPVVMDGPWPDPAFRRLIENIVAWGARAEDSPDTPSRAADRAIPLQA